MVLVIILVAQYTIIIMRNPQNSLGNYLGSYAKSL